MGHLVEPDAIRFVKGRVDQRSREPNVIVDQMLTMEEVERTFTDKLAVKFQHGLHDEQDMIRVRDVISRHPGTSEVVLLAEMPDETNPGQKIRYVLQTPDSFRVGCTTELKNELVEAIGEMHFKFHAQPIRKAGQSQGVGR